MKKVLILLSCIGAVQARDLIKVYNTTEKPIFAAIYCRPTLLKSVAVRDKALYRIAPNTSVNIPRMGKSFTCTRRLTFAFNAQSLPTTIKKRRYDRLASLGVGITSGRRTFDSFYLALDKHGALVGYNPLHWQAHQLKESTLVATSAILDQYKQQLITSSPLVQDNPYKEQTATVRVAQSVSDQERAYLQKRLPKVKAALQTFLGKNLNGNYIPKIALINSGGGARALTCSLGWHLGAEHMGLLDAVSYDIGLSGGSWFLALWYASQQSVRNLRPKIKQIMQTGLVPPQGKVLSTDETKQFFDALLIRNALKQPTTLVNAWGALLATRYVKALTDKTFMLYDVKKQLKDGQWPLPILTAVDGYSGDFEKNRHKIGWFEFTPFEVSGVGNWLAHAHIPTWGFGRVYDGLRSIDKNPAYDIGLMMGICGSAFAFSFARAFEETLGKLPIIGKLAHVIITRLKDPEYIRGKRLSVGKAPNFAKDVPGSQQKRNILKIVDGGLAFNLPSPPAHGRADILIFTDASAGILGHDLMLAQKYACYHNVPFPKISLDDIEKRPVSIFFDEDDLDKPLVIYIPRTRVKGLKYPSVVSKSFDTNISTGKFVYSAALFDQLVAVTQTNIEHSAPQIKAAIENYIARKGGF